MSAPPQRPGHDLPPSLSQLVDDLCLDFEAAWKQGQRPRLEEYLPKVNEPGRAALFGHLLGLDLDYRRQRGEEPRPDEYLPCAPEFATLVRAVFEEDKRPDGSDALPPTTPQPAQPIAASLPDHFGRYRVLERLGSGTFGAVFKGYDDDAARAVAIKMPHRRTAYSAQEADAFLAEARLLACLDHPGIVPVYDVGRTEQGLCYLVCKLIPGSDLAQRLRQAKLPERQAAHLVACVAEALHHAHQRGLTHRDLKPANILLDADDRPVVADFGLALRAEEFGTGPEFAGTPAYMSPEQARGEGHRVDARTDIYSLGVIFYELLTGHPPFCSDNANVDAILEQIKTVEPPPPRQLDGALDAELERVCLKALAKRPAERYDTAASLAQDLRRWLAIRRPRRQRAQRCLAEQADRWNAQPQNRHLPTLGQWLHFRLLTRRRDWTGPQRALMRRTARYHLTRLAVFVTLLVTVPWLVVRAVDRRNAAYADRLVDQLIETPHDQLPGLLPEVKEYGRWARQRLAEISQDSRREPRERLNACVALELGDRAPMDEGLAGYFIDRLLRAKPEEFQILREALKGPDGEYSKPLGDLLEKELQRVPSTGDYDGDELARRQARAAVALLHLGSGAVWERLRHRADPGARTPSLDPSPLLCPLNHAPIAAGPNLRARLIRDLGRLMTDVQVVLDRLVPEENVSARRALILSLGGFPCAQLAPAQRDSVVGLLLRWYREDPDAGIHSAIDWLLRHQWKEPPLQEPRGSWHDQLREIDRNAAGRHARGQRWRVTAQGGHTLASVTRWQKDFWYGAPAEEPGRDPVSEPRHQRRIDRMFAIATKEVTVAQFEEFLEARPEFKPEFDTSLFLDKNQPVAGVSWFLAAEYCNWLSEHEEWFAPEHQCFVRTGPRQMALRPNYLKLRGYRLPTAAEWEYACRAGEVTSRFFGTSEALLAEYAWFAPTSRGRLRPVGQLKPNDLGLFDLYGNAAEWCLNPTFGIPPNGGPPFYDTPVQEARVEAGQPWVVRGGSFRDGAAQLRSAYWTRQPVDNGGPTVGFRVARTTVMGP